MPMPVSFEDTEIEGVKLVKTGLFRDERGFFSESHSQKIWSDAGFDEVFVQDNLSSSSQGTLRGMHYQLHPHGMGKLVRCLHGSIFDVAVDLREGSPTYAKWVGFRLDAENGLSLWVPVGFAHSFLALEDESLVHYKCTSMHSVESERSLNYQDPTIGIEWPTAPSVVSQKDRDAPLLPEADLNFVYSEGAT
jgi:dTDP-4-dehydrorhamnose 3,5-epimerase